VEDLGVKGLLTVKWIFEKCNGAWPGLIWLRIGTGCVEVVINPSFL
jgi:hypothetical protein